MGPLILVVGIIVIFACSFWSSNSPPGNKAPAFFAFLGVLLILLGGYIYSSGG